MGALASVVKIHLGELTTFEAFIFA
ncbi:MAG: hypothetical protein QOF95_3279, partial [Pseudonocardiales bacterium]|nr:hypothetical protein [Pseudonocardiales bacterium]